MSLSWGCRSDADDCGIHHRTQQAAENHCDRYHFRKWTVYARPEPADLSSQPPKTMEDAQGFVGLLKMSAHRAEKSLVRSSTHTQDLILFGHTIARARKHLAIGKIAMLERMRLQTHVDAATESFFQLLMLDGA